MGRPKNASYRRSWRNLLLASGYQLSITLLMVLCAGVLMVLLGMLAYDKTRDATTIYKNNLPTCPEVPPMQLEFGQDALTVAREHRCVIDDAKSAGNPVKPQAQPGPGSEAEPSPPAAAVTPPAASPPPPESLSSSGDVARRTTISIDSEPIEVKPLDNPYVQECARQRQECTDKNVAARAELESGQRGMLYILIGIGLALCIGLFMYGIKMTHRVAGPLHKISLYIGKMREGRLDTVYNLRKGDQLTEFYEHFKKAHAGVSNMQREDIEVLKQVVAAADDAGMASKSKELAEAIEELRALAKRKEESFV